MLKSRCFHATLLSVILLATSGTAFARIAGSFADYSTVHSSPASGSSRLSNPSPLASIVNAGILDDDGDRDRDRDRNRNRDRDHDKGDDGGHHGPAPTPEPSTLFSFAAALLIAGGVFLSRRLRSSRK